MDSSGLTLRKMVYAAIFGAATAIGAFIIIPFPLVPITLQTLFMNLAAALLGGRIGALSQVIYILLGIMGLPVFAGGKAGLGVLFGPTGGYLFGFIVSAFIIGSLIHMKKAPGILWTVFSMILGLIALYILGVAQLMFVAKLSIKKSLTVGVLPFLIGDGLKIAAATLLSMKLRDRLKF